MIFLSQFNKNKPDLKLMARIFGKSFFTVEKIFVHKVNWKTDRWSYSYFLFILASFKKFAHYNYILISSNRGTFRQN